MLVFSGLLRSALAIPSEKLFFCTFSFILEKEHLLHLVINLKLSTRNSACLRKLLT